jgi:uncharacterized protein (TIGR02271 family)
VAAGEGTELQLAREEFEVGKREVENGGVLLRKTVKTQDASQPIELKREEYTIDRTPANGQAVASADFREREIRIDLTREEPVVGVRDFVTEYIRVRKKVETDRQNIAGTVRRENLEIVKTGDSGRPAAGLDRSDTAQGGTAAQSGVTTSTASSRTLETGRDQALRERVRTTLSNGKDGSASYSNLEINSDLGVITLKGTVSSEAEKDRIGKRVKEISGVRSVKNELQVAAKK